MQPHAIPIDDIYLAALALPAGSERATYLDQACAANPEVRERIERLLRAQPHAEGFLESAAAPGLSAFAPTFTGPAVPEEPGTEIGPYKLREVLGEGGMGIVYVAEQEKPVRRKVALKVINPGMDTREVIARFEAERQALALMDHPNIAKVLDAGSTGAATSFSKGDPSTPPLRQPAGNSLPGFGLDHEAPLGGS